MDASNTGMGNGATDLHLPSRNEYTWTRHLEKLNIFKVEKTTKVINFNSEIGHQEKDSPVSKNLEPAN